MWNRRTNDNQYAETINVWTDLALKILEAAGYP